ncbi:carboxylate-amine ligase [Marinivivus vitaminiproducens]|uniref:carboxylate-amine ligase n=1 Tax=Marinivivus vitaminiproducens TaxID=3035935 RepID=UPI0027A6C090|nr:carboxylate-amine ligase [Geminicoccaceae bacterium SCSIO 64248]
MSTPSLSLGIEEEYLLIDPATRDLVREPPKAFFQACADALGDAFSNELLQAQVEIGTPACADIDQARVELARLRRSVAEIAGSFGIGLVAASTHPFASWRNQKRVEKARYDSLAADMQIAARRLAICGMHIHCAIEDPDLRIDLMRQAAYFLPHMLALSTSSPYWRGEDTGLKAYRPSVFRDLPRTGLPEQLTCWADWQNLIDLLERTELCDDASKIWWDLRPSIKFPTLEMRVCDICTTMEDAIAIAALFQALMAFLARLHRENRSWRVYRPTLIAENMWRAQRYGVEGAYADFGAAALKPFALLMQEMAAMLAEEAGRLGTIAELRHVGTIVERGTSADRQRAVFAQAQADGADEHQAQHAVVDWLMAETLVGTQA